MNSRPLYKKVVIFMLDLTEVKNYIRADDDDDMVLSLMKASFSYMEGAVDDFAVKYQTLDANWIAKADLCMKLLVADWYENRTPMERPTNSAIPLLLAQLQLEGVQNV